MAISAPGVGSGLDVNSIVTQLVAIERQPLQALQTKASTFQSQLSLYGKVKSQAQGGTFDKAPFSDTKDPFYGYAAWLVARYALAVDNEPMTTINWNKSHVYWLAFAGFALMTVRGVQVAIENWRRGFSPLQNPGFFDGSAN